jgi:F-type H+-transporting ATPase subunit b
MNISATLIGQSIAFFLFVWFCMKFVWPPIMKALDERKKTIADGLAAGEKGKHELELAERRAGEVVRDAKGKAGEILSQAEKRAGEVIDEAKHQAKTEAEGILAAARAEVYRERNAAREQLRQQVATLAVAGAARILEKEIDAKSYTRLLDDVVKQL